MSNGCGSQSRNRESHVNDQMVSIDFPWFLKLQRNQFKLKRKEKYWEHKAN